MAFSHNLYSDEASPQVPHCRSHSWTGVEAPQWVYLKFWYATRDLGQDAFQNNLPPWVSSWV